MRSILVYLLLVCTLPLCAADRFEVHREGAGWKIARNGQPFYVQGMTFGTKIDPATIDAKFADLKDFGVNAIRTWGVGADTKLLLDTAHKHGITVMVGLWLRHGRAGAEGDDSFNWINDEKGKQDQWSGVISDVMRYKDHPAVMMWCVGNEVILNIATEEEKNAYAEFLGKLTSEIKRIDPGRLIASAGAWTLECPYWQAHCPDIDIYGINTYGPGAQALPEEFARLKLDKPYILTEFGPRGEWDAPKDRNGLAREPQDDEKYQNILDGWREWIKPKAQCLGVFMFNYNNEEKANHAAIWLSAKIEDRFRPGALAVREAFTGKKPDNTAPVVTNFSLPRDMGKAGEWIPVKLAVSDAENDKLNVTFRYNQRLEGQSRHKRDAVIPLEARGSLEAGFEVKPPNEKGLIKIYAFIDDGKNLTIPYASFVISDRDPQAQERWGKKAELPFYVYKDEGAGANHYVPSGLMGDMGNISINYNSRENPQAGASCIEVSYKAGSGWFGLAYQDPANDWGASFGGYDLTGAKKLTFWARGAEGGEKVKFGFGMITRQNQWYDTAIADTGDLRLDKEWKQYEIPLEGYDLRRIKTGFSYFFGAPGKPVKFYLDEIRYE